MSRYMRFLQIIDSKHIGNKKTNLLKNKIKYAELNKLQRIT